MRVKHYTTKSKICFSSSINFVYNKKKIQIFGVNMNSVLSNEVKNLLGLWIARQVAIQSDPRVGSNDSQIVPRT